MSKFIKYFSFIFILCCWKWILNHKYIEYSFKFSLCNWTWIMTQTFIKYSFKFSLCYWTWIMTHRFIKYSSFKFSLFYWTWIFTLNFSFTFSKLDIRFWDTNFVMILFLTACIFVSSNYTNKMLEYINQVKSKKKFRNRIFINNHEYLLQLHEQTLSCI